MPFSINTQPAITKYQKQQAVWENEIYNTPNSKTLPRCSDRGLITPNEKRRMHVYTLPVSKLEMQSNFVQLLLETPKLDRHKRWSPF
jgi:hypothetical protein